MDDRRFDVRPFLEQKEGQHFERKSMRHGAAGRKRSRNRQAMREEVAQYVAAFANADGGVLLLGIEDDGTVSGHDLPAEALAALLGAPAARLDPPQPDGFVVMHADREVIVASKLLTGFDASWNTVLYICKSLKEHNLLQAIARVNRLYEESNAKREKQFGFIIDYEGLLGELDRALSTYNAFVGYEPADLLRAVTGRVRRSRN